jgi:hypothetical protein
MAAAYVPMEIDQGEDFTCQLVYTDEFDEPYLVVDPCRLDIKNNQGAIQLSLETPDSPLPEGEIPEIALSDEAGMIQIHIEDTATEALLPGVYQYDLFVTVNDGNEYAGNQRQRLVYGEVVVNKRITQM